MEPWLTTQQAGLIYGLAGGGVGVLGGILGMCAPLMRMGRAKPLVYTLHGIGALIGLAGVVVGFVALLSGQPFIVWFHAMNIGVICAFLFVGLYFMLTRRVYAMAERRKLDAGLMREGAVALAALVALMGFGAGARADGGPRVLVERVPGAKSVAIISAFDTGFLHDPRGRAQMAHLAEHLWITSATGDYAQGQAALVAGPGNGETQPTFMYFDRVCPLEAIGAALRVERGRFDDLRFDQGDVVREGPRCASEVDVVAANEGLWLAKFALMGAAQGWLHGAAHANLRTGLEAIPAEDVQRFMRERMTGAGHTLAIVGDRPEADLRAAGESAFAALSGAGERPAPVFVDWSRQPKERTMTWDVPGRAVFVCAPPPEDPLERAALSLYAGALAERLARSKPSAARSVAGTCPTWPMGELPFLVFAAIPTEADPGATVAQLHALLDEACERGCAEEDMEAVRTMARWFTPYSATPNLEATLASVRARAGAGADADRMEAMAVGNIALRHVMADQFARQSAPADEAASVSAERLTEILRATLARERRFVTTLGPK